ncbi:MAG: hypothetical protein NUW09_01645 [Deltaproteobacteria bacterium]|nr:hypothetical protein [Deltaproteobacteria bacterium]
MPTLQEVRTYPATDSLTTPKDAYCAYNKLYKAAVETPVSAWCTGFFSPWVSTWDPALKSGEIFLGPREPHPVILFRITENKTTVVEAKIGYRGATGCATESLSQQRISDILASADFSGCPDLN